MSTYKYPLLLACIILLGFFLRFRLAQDQYLHKWDERFHALVAKNLMQHPLEPTLYETPLLSYDYKNWYSNHIWLHKQPLPLWLMSGSYALFGISEFNTRIPSLILSTLAIYITFLLGTAFFNKRAGLLAAFFMAINGVVLEIGSGRIATDHYDILFMVFIEISILFAYYNSKNGRLIYSLLSGILLGFAILSKWMPAMIVLPLQGILLLKEGFSKKQVITQVGFTLLTSCIIFIPWQIYILKDFPLESRWEYYHNWLHIATQLEGQPDDGWLHYIHNIRIKYSEVIYIPLAYLVYKLIKNKFRPDHLLLLFVWIFVPILFFSFAKTKMTGYILFACPALFIVMAWFFFELKDRLGSFSNAFAKAIAVILLILMIVLPIRFCYERSAFGLEAPATDKYAEDYRKLKNRIPEKAVILNVERPIELMFYTDCIAYSNPIIEKVEKDKIRALGYSIFYLNPDRSGLTQESPAN